MRVFERRECTERLGAGIQVSPNGASVLAELGLKQEIREFGTKLSQVRLHDRGKDREFAAFSPWNPALVESPYLLMHRKDLIDALRRAACRSGVGLQFGSRIEDVTSDGRRAKAYLRNGTKISANFLVGADGIHSVTARHLAGRELQFGETLCVWRATSSDGDCKSTMPMGVVRLELGPDRHLVIYAVRNGKFLNAVALVGHDGDHNIVGNRKWSIEEMLSALPGTSPFATRLLRQCQRTRCYNLPQREIAPVWSRGKVGLIGDALHPMLPTLGQGANAGFEDAWTLAILLDRFDTVEGALTAFRSLRLRRIRRLVRMSKLQARSLHLAKPIMILMRRTGLRLASRMAPGLLQWRLNWIYAARASDHAN